MGVDIPFPCGWCCETNLLYTSNNCGYYAHQDRGNERGLAALPSWHIYAGGIHGVHELPQQPAGGVSGDP